MIATQTAMILAFILAALTLTGRVREWHIIVLAVLLGRRRWCRWSSARI
jgi:hypothetical protein